jgi:hypothetical protein
MKKAIVTRKTYAAETEVLALAAGFSIQQAEGIANATQWPDDPRSGVYPVDYTRAAMEARRLYHFTDQTRRDALWKNFSDLVAEGNPEAYSALGTFLHAQEDSFSHEGFGYKLGQGTALFDNFGIFSSIKSMWNEAEKYDRTSFDPDKAERMARDTLGRLMLAMSMMAASKKFGSFQKPVSFERFESKFREWARTNDPKEKKRLIKEIKILILRAREDKTEPADKKRKTPALFVGD